MKKKVFRKSIISIALSLLMLANLLPQFSAVAAENTNNLNLYAGDMIRQGSSQFNGGNIADANCTEFDTNNGVLLLKAGNISSASFKGKYKSYSYNFNLTPSWGTGLTSQWGFAMYFMDTDGVSAHWTHGNNSRYMIYATASNKIQLARFNGSQVASWLTGEIVIPDMNNKDLQCLLACIDENGSTKVSLSINDVKYIDYVDSSAQRLTEAGYITMLNNGSGAGLSLKISGNNPNNIPTYSPTAKKIDAGDLIRTGAANFSGNNIADGNKVSFNAANGNLTLKSGDISSVSNKNAYKNFDYNFKMNPSWGNGLESSQWGFAMYFMDTDGVSAHWAHGSNSRYMIIANSSTNLQLARFNGSQDASWLTGNIPVPDMNNKMLTCRLNCFDENGITRIILTINGTEYINYSDNTTQRLTTAGYITFLNHGSGAGLSLTIGGCTLGTTSSYVGDSLTLNASDMITQGNTQFNGMNIGNTNSVAFDTNKGNMVLRTGTINSASYKQTYSNFNYNFTLNPRWGSGLESKWGFAMFFMDTDGVNAQGGHGSNSRYMLIFNDSTDVQLARYNGSQVAAWLTENNKIPNISNQLLQYQLVCREENGATRIVLLIDGIT
jgi:hypothetical protein